MAQKKIKELELLLSVEAHAGDGAGDLKPGLEIGLGPGGRGANSLGLASRIHIDFFYADAVVKVNGEPLLPLCGGRAGHVADGRH
jgi:hypothetical protein